MANNPALCGEAPAGTNAQFNTQGSGLGKPCGDAVEVPPPTTPDATANATTDATTDATDPVPSPADPLAPPPGVAVPSPAVLVSPSPDTTTTTASPAPGEVPTLPAEQVSTSPAPSPSPKPPVQIATQIPICACATRGYGSKQCQDAWAERCKGKPKDSDRQACASYEKAGSDVAAASAVSKILAEECFGGQSMTMDPCVCMAVSGCGSERRFPFE